MRAFGLIAVVIALGVGLYIYRRSIDAMPGGSPQQQVDTVAIRQRLLTIAQAERQYQAGNGKYGTLEQLASDGLLPGGTAERGYTYSADVGGAGFTITAVPTAANKTGWPTLSINESMQVTEQ